MITFIIDKVINCLENTETHELVQTEAFRIYKKKDLARFHSRNGWHINWSKLPQNIEVYGLSVVGESEVEGLIAISYDEDNQAVYMQWACTAPQNNVYEYGTQKYKGVGGHLFAIASELSVKHGYGGYIYGDAADRKLFEYYCNEFGAYPLPGGPTGYRIMILEELTERLREEYTYGWRE